MAVSHEELVALFGADNVVTADRAALAGLGLSPAAERVLTEVGLPAAPAEGLPASPFTAAAPAPAGPARVLLGRLFEDDVEACLDLSTGAVVSRYAGGGPDTEVFVNSGLAQFVESVYLVNRTGLEMSEDDDPAAAAELERQLRELDPPALGDHAWWTSVLDEMQM